MPPDTDNSVAIGITTIALLTSIAFLAAVRRFIPSRFALMTALTLLWLGLWAGLASSGVLAQFHQRPPPLLWMFASSLLAGLALGLSPLGRGLADTVPLWALVLFQSFRLPLELCMAEAAQLGLMPVEMSIEGYNFDFLTGAIALPLAWALWLGAPVWLARWWSWVGTLLLNVIAVLAVASSPMIQAFGPDHVNSWVAYFPYVWLPTVLVVFAIAGHIVVFRSLGKVGASRAASDTGSSKSCGTA
jgi:hypothetical protein